MILDRLDATAFGVGLGALTLVLLALHLLRVRVRRVEVDSLLFFAAAARPVRRRALWGIPTGWLAFLLGWLLLACLWAAFAGLRDNPGNGPSRIVLLDASGRVGDWDREWPAVGGLGPAGQVRETGPVHTGAWRSAGEPGGLGPARRALRQPTQPSGGDAGLPGALLRAARAVGPDGEVLVVGGPGALPERVLGAAIRRLPANGAQDGTGAFRLVDIRLPRTPGSPLEVTVWDPTGTAAAAALGGPPVPLDRQGALARAALPVREEARGAGPMQLQVLAEGGGVVSGWDLQLPARQPAPVAWAEDLPTPLRVALAADPALRRAGPEDAPALRVALAGTDTAAGPGAVRQNSAQWLLHGDGLSTPDTGGAGSAQLPLRPGPDQPSWLATVPRPRLTGVLEPLGEALDGIWWTTADGLPVLGTTADGTLHSCAGLFTHGGDGAVPRLALELARQLTGMDGLAIAPLGNTGSDHAEATTSPVSLPTAPPPAAPTGAIPTAPAAVATGDEPGWLPIALLAGALVLLLLDLWWHHRGALP